MDLMTYISARLENVRRNGDNTLQCRCPGCASIGGDSTGKNHLRIWQSGAFRCVKDDSREHNKLIRSFIYPDDISSQETRLFLDTIYIDPDPRPDFEKVYPETMLDKLLPVYDYWEGRGVSVDTLHRVGGGLAPIEEKSKMSGRWVHPIRNDQKQIVGFSGRLIQPNSFAPSWKHLFRSSKVCWPWYLNGEEIRRTRKVILVESIGDALSLSTVGIHNWLVLFGLNMNSKVLGHLASANLSQIIISTNNDTLGKASSKEAGNKAALKVKGQLNRFFNEGTVSIRLPQMANDWNRVLLEHPEELDVFKREVVG